MNYIDWIVVGVLGAAVIFMAYRFPSFRAKLIQNIQSHEAEIVQMVYNRLPDKVKAYVDSKDFADIVVLGMDSIIKIVEDELDKKQQNHQ